MALRGTGSLQELLGRNFFAKKRTNGNNKRPRDEAPPSGDPPPPAGGQSPLKAEHARCPVCIKQLPSNDLDAFNSHLDKCLSKSRVKRPGVQSTLLKFKAPTTAPVTSSPAATPAPAPTVTIPTSTAHPQPLPAAPSQPSPARPSTSSAPSPPPSSFKSPQPSPSKPGLGGSRSPHRRLATPLSVPPPTCFPTSIVGRKYRQGGTLALGQRLLIVPEVGNPRDGNALLVVDAASQLPLGHVPRAVAQHLGPLLRKGTAAAEAVVVEVPDTDRAPACIDLHVTLLPGVNSPERAGAALHRAKEAAASAGGGNGNGGGTGEHLRRNFLILIDTVCREDGGLLDEEELGFVAAFKSCTAPGQCLFLRLWQRRGPLFRLAALTYQEVPDAAAAVAELHAHGLASQLEGATAEEERELCAAWEELAGVLTVPELQAVLLEMQKLSGKGYSYASSLPRPQLLSALAKVTRQGGAAAHTALCGLLLDATGPLVRLDEAAVVAARRLQRLFFLNEGQSLSQYLATDMGGLRYPPYKVHRTRSVFTSREHLLEYEQALRHASDLTDALEEGDTAAAEAAVTHAWTTLDAARHKPPQTDPTLQPAPPLYLRRFCAPWIYCMMATAGVSLLEKHKQYGEAVERLRQLLGGWCCPSRRGEWWLRLSIDLEHMHRPVQSLEVAEAALADEWLSPGDRLALQRRVLRLGKPPRRWKVPGWAETARWEPREVRIVGRPLESVIGIKSRFYGLDGEQCGVEELALQHYASAEGGGWEGTHSEGGIWATLFGLLMFEVLFTGVPDVFRTPFQTQPLDLNTDAFYPTRIEAIEACLANIAAGAAPGMLAAAWDAHCGCMCRGINWERWTLAELQLVATCVGGPGLAAVCRLLAQAGWSGGMPDLLLWHVGRGVAKLSEVKGPRDRLSDQQRAWMAALGEVMEVEVLKVVEPTAGGKGKGGKGKGGKMGR